MNLAHAGVLFALLVSTSGCASHVSESTTLTAASLSSALVIGPEIQSHCRLHPSEGAADAQDSGGDPPLLSSAEIGTIEQLATCFTTGPMKGRTLTLSGRADPRGWPQHTGSVGDRRTDAVQRKLVTLGVSLGSVTTTSHGATGKHDARWQTDRRIDVDVDVIPGRAP